MTEVHDYVPRSLMPFVLSDKCDGYSYEPVDGPNDGESSVYWIYLSPGWQWSGLHSVSGATVKDCLQQIRELEPCTCEECLENKPPRL